jgi:hypothetical protein
MKTRSSGRKGSRLEVSEHARKTVLESADHYGMLCKTVQSQMVEWFASQPVDVQKAILLNLPDAGERFLRASAAKSQD